MRLLAVKSIDRTKPWWRACQTSRAPTKLAPMRHLSPADYKKMPWKNGGGITYEIASEADAQGLLWRLSLADVTGDGPYSLFGGLQRILTVVTGAGTRLIDRQDGATTLAAPLVPTAFSGDQTMHAELVDGAIRNLNLIFDPRRLSAHVQLVEGPTRIALPGIDSTRHMIYGHSAEFQAPQVAGLALKPGETCTAVLPGTVVDCVAGAKILWVELSVQSKRAPY